MKKLLLTLAALAMTSPAFANVICTGCEDGDAAGNFLGAFNAQRGDLATFQNSDVGRTAFADFWVFDLTPAAIGSLSADFTLLASIGGFFGELYRDAGSVCGASDCGSVALGALIGSATALGGRWEILDFFTPGRYVLKIGGQSTGLIEGAYTGQMAFLAVSVREVATLGLLGLGLCALGMACQRHQR
jgi:hypothetical protein